MKYMKPYIHSNKHKNRPNKQEKLTKKNIKNLSKLSDFLEEIVKALEERKKAVRND